MDPKQLGYGRNRAAVAVPVIIAITVAVAVHDTQAVAICLLVAQVSKRVDKATAMADISCADSMVDGARQQ